ncbi:predicted protein [Aspergillus nidulans FGSC A4]|uniref:Uncharacterized protein n=1 Tax=Emericella nidulans (strain FGSC A4 / ATCC 38163 / CBS 112.46 / NRRL 194 / M139) TaxID=227321 RepID=Q5AS04_EMENI|nr:hypothetical protein [Aspergillus nidulans FGSC A4]EAA64060.1 predicted protein [Aspergillus nidulans FGSC A4]CBF84644.1 TPA: hypothetical protein ANIA_08926 [Aspergillus nidulans FGSC A4]|eukprot:XP_682195.1 predicted protein [Aspergillus nidulans FGSC A4]
MPFTAHPNTTSSSNDWSEKDVFAMKVMRKSYGIVVALVVSRILGGAGHLGGFQRARKVAGGEDEKGQRGIWRLLGLFYSDKRLGDGSAGEEPDKTIGVLEG